MQGCETVGINMAEEAARRKMKLAETMLNVSIKDLNEKCDNGINPSELWVTRKIATLASHWSSFEEAHTTYVELVTLEDTEEAYEHLGRVSLLYEDAVEKGHALRDPHQLPLPVAPLRATVQEQYDLAAHERQSTITESQKEKVARAEELLKGAHMFTTTMAGLKPEHAERDLAADSAKKIEVIGEMYERRKLPSSGGARQDNLSLRCEWQANVTGKFSDVQEEMTKAEADYLEELEEELAELEIPGLAFFAENLADAEQRKVENSTIDQADEVKEEQVEVSKQKAEMETKLLHTMKADDVQFRSKQADIQEAEEEDSFPYEPGACAEAEAMVDQTSKQNSGIMEAVENSALTQLSEVETSSKAEVVLVMTNSKKLLDEMKFEEEEHSVADLKIDKEVDGLDLKAKEADVMKLKEKKQGVSDLMIDKKGKETVDFKAKEEKLCMKAEAKLNHTEKAEAVDEVRMPRLSKRKSCDNIDERMEEKVIRDEKERHKLSPLEADKLLPPERHKILRLLIDKSAAVG